jgi:hypothetical protein
MQNADADAVGAGYVLYRALVLSIINVKVYRRKFCGHSQIFYEKAGSGLGMRLYLTCMLINHRGECRRGILFMMCT